MRKVELLSPAGNYECFEAALKAGADAVYLGGNRFGARAYAENFSQQEICEACHHAHLWNKKVYLTLNTLLKDSEIIEVCDYIAPLYEAGLDGVIVQDFGVMKMLKEYFPELEIHASTQMTVTGANGAELLKEYGVSRIVPARELSLDEIAEIKSKVQIEVETFIHGAMCYAYSGQCLFSSFLGGRSGNRGRCAGPCRLPYDVYCGEKRLTLNKEQYPLSLKDMCSVSLIPELIEAGIDSFKIEGRMKSAEYVAGVTHIYRKYIDSYPHKKSIAKEDLVLLHNLYVRSELDMGYYKRHNGKEMVTLNKPSYQTGSKELLAGIRKEWIEKPMKFPIEGKCILRIGEPCRLQISLKARGKTYTVEGKSDVVVERAEKAPMEPAGIREKLEKTGNSKFVFKALKIEAEDHVYIPIKALNQLRRNTLELIEEKVLEQTMRQREPECYNRDNSELYEINKDTFMKSKLTIVVNKMEQLRGVCDNIEKYDIINRIIIPIDLLSQKEGSELFVSYFKQCRKKQISIFLSFPNVIRWKAVMQMKDYKDKIFARYGKYIQGVLVGNLEAMAYIKKEFPNIKMMSDYNLYAFNQNSFLFLRDMGICEMTLPLEWSKHEVRNASKEMLRNSEAIIYGRIPLMESAGCVLKTVETCDSDCQKDNIFLKDRYHKRFPVVVHCNRCENTIYNSVPLSLKDEMKAFQSEGIQSFRIVLTTETEQESIRVLSYFLGDSGQMPPYQEYTKGHYKKGVQ